MNRPTTHPSPPLTLAHRRLIEAVAQAIVQDYLRAQAAPGKDSGAVCTDRVPLPAADRAA